jgi:hypothetical protein
MTLPVDAVVETEDAEAVLVELAGQVRRHHVLELVDVVERRRVVPHR